MVGCGWLVWFGWLVGQFSAKDSSWKKKSMTTARGRFDFVEGVDGWQETSIHAAASP
jgi:hypothetical protein